MNVDGGGVDLLGLYTLALLVNLAAMLFASGVAMRLRTMQAGPPMQVPVFLTLFLAPVYVPLDLLTGWVHAAASVNPITRFLEAGRACSPASRHVLLAFACAIGSVAVTLLGARRTAQRRARRVIGSPP